MATPPEPATPRRPSPSLLIVAGLLAAGAIAIVVFLLARPGSPVSGATSVPSATATPATAASPPPTVVPLSSPAASGALVIITPSPAPTRAPTARPTGTPSTAPTIVSFTAPATVQCSGGEVRQITLSWRVERATGVTLSIDGPGTYDDYPATATVQVPFACSESQHTYRITTTGGSGPAATMEKVVRRA